VRDPGVGVLERLQVQVDVAGTRRDDLDREEDVSGGRPLERAVAPDDDQVRSSHDRQRIRARHHLEILGALQVRGKLGLDLPEEPAPPC
jgi:hypothetical protein